MVTRSERSASNPAGALTVVFALTPVLLSMLVYFPITENYFFGDDLLNLYRLVNWGPVRFLLQPYAGHILIVRNAIFSLCYYVFGTKIELYFHLVAATYCLNVFLLFLVIRSFTKSDRLACFGATLWGMSPINVATLGWYSVYGQVLVGTSTAWMLYAIGRLAEGEAVGRYAPIRWAVLALATSTFFGTGIGVAMAMPFVAFVLLPPSPDRTRVLSILAGVTLFVPVLYFGLYHFFPTGGLRFVSLQLLAEWPHWAAALVHLEGNGIANLLLGVFHTRFRYPSLVSLGLVGMFAACVVVALIRGPGSSRRQILACLLLGAAAYGAVALGRSMFIAAGMDPERITHNERYQYVSPMTLAIVLCVALSRIPTWGRLPAVVKNTLLVASLSALLGTHLVYGKPVDHHAGSRRLTNIALAEIRKHVDAAPPGADVYIPYGRFLGVGPMLAKHPESFPGLAGVFVVFFPENTVDGKRVRFVLDDEFFLDEVAQGRRSRDLFVMAEDVPARQREIE